MLNLALWAEGQNRDRNTNHQECSQEIEREEVEDLMNLDESNRAGTVEPLHGPNGSFDDLLESAVFKKHLSQRMQLASLHSLV
jgi:hypothetical protein